MFQTTPLMITTRRRATTNEPNIKSIKPSFFMLANAKHEIRFHERYVHNDNIAHYRRLIAESERNPKHDEDRHAMLLTLLAEEIAKEKKATQ